MKKAFALVSLAVLASAAYAHPESDHWFDSGESLAWYEHPCGFEAFVKYGNQDTPQNRANYYITIKHPEMCSKLFPVEGAQHAPIRR
jgi:hypothetical protein